MTWHFLVQESFLYSFIYLNHVASQCKMLFRTSYLNQRSSTPFCASFPWASWVWQLTKAISQNNFSIIVVYLSRAKVDNSFSQRAKWETNKLNPYWCPVSHVAPWGNELRNSDLKFVIEDHHICLHFNTMLPSRQLMIPSIWAGIPSHRVFSRGYPCSGWMVLCPFSMFSLNLQNSPPLNRYVLPLWAQMKAASTLFTVSPDFFLMPQSERGRG